MALGQSRTATELIDRGPELSVVDQLFEHASSGRLACALIVGEPGVGKTLLCTTFLNRHQAESLCLTARGYPYGATTSFGL